jgi:NAD-dependent dihydropyrimidine dehydrogenase PreA subunit
MSYETKGTLGDVSLRHAAIAAGLGNFGRHNLVIHPQIGSRVVFTAVMTNLDLPSDPPVSERICTDCNICVENCPAHALDEEGKTDDMKCLKPALWYWERYPLLDQICREHNRRTKKDGKGRELLASLPGWLHWVSIFLF